MQNRLEVGKLPVGVPCPRSFSSIHFGLGARKCRSSLTLFNIVTKPFGV